MKRERLQEKQYAPFRKKKITVTDLKDQEVFANAV